MGTSSDAMKGALKHDGREPHLLREIVRTYQVLMASFSREMGMPSSRFVLLRLLAVEEGERGVVDLARRLGIDPAAVTRLVQEMERDKLVYKRAAANDRRRSLVVLSAKGRRLFEEIHARNHELEGRLATAVGEAEMASAAAILEKVRVLIESRR
jgi:DNA-binding MarR family transcriptional regulator